MSRSPGFGALWLDGIGQIVKVRNLTINGGGVAYPAIKLAGSGSLVLENCVFEDLGGPGLDIEPIGPLNLVIKNCRISNSASGVLFKPAAGGSIHATLDHVTIANNSGGGIKVDTADGPVTTDIDDSTISDNGGNGVNAVGGAGGQNIVSIKNSAIAKNLVAGVQSNGPSAGVLVANTLLDQNAAGATSIVNGGNMFSYGNNQVVGSLGAAFNQMAPLH